MKEKRLEFDQICTLKSPGGYLRQLQKVMKFDRFEEVCPGELVYFNLPSDMNFTLAYKGEKPEKYDVVDGLLSVLVPSCIIIFTYKTKDDSGNLVSRIEVIKAL